ncbi:Lipase 3 [Harpegnathos saltator]|uniref:Lipase 3 n=1 Tax=Harpegnathos saltator TaxID=610380 RepID=E2BQV8_HARSA|nr:Lipase 3 [Harpegnathos saltator]
MMRTSIKLAIILVLALLNAELILSNGELFPRAFVNFLFPKDLNLVRVRALDEVNRGKDVKILDFIGLVTRHGYPAEEHNVITEDGYNLKIHRIPDSPLSNNKKNKKVVFLQHGIISSSDSWVLFGPGKDLVFLLADQGYDVWLGNVRGSTYSRSHVKMSPRNKDFWQFSYHEVGTIDLPNMIDYVLTYTGQGTLSYIGHSMGTTVLFVLLSTRPEYNAKISLGICLAPIAFWNEVPPVINTFIAQIPILMEFFDKNEVYEVTPLESRSIATRKLLCAEYAKTQAFCIAILFMLAGSDPLQINTTALPEILTYYPTSTSVLTIYHFYQNIVTRDFRSYDYKYSIYGHLTSKRYELEKITTPLALIYGTNDVLATRSVNIYFYLNFNILCCIE